MILSKTLYISLSPTNERQAVIAESINALCLEVMELLREYNTAQKMLTFSDWLKTSTNSYRHIAVPCGYYGLDEPPMRLSLAPMHETRMFEKGHAPMIIRGARELAEQRYTKNGYFNLTVARWCLAKKFTAFTSSEIQQLQLSVLQMYPTKPYLSLFAFDGGFPEKINYRHGIDTESMTFLFRGRLMRVKGKTEQERITRRDMMLFSLKTANKLKKNRKLSIAA